MTEEEYEKKVRGTKTFCIIIGVLFVLGIFVNISQQNYTNVVLALGFLILLYLFYSFTKKKKIAGPIIGIILGWFIYFTIKYSNNCCRYFCSWR